MDASFFSRDKNKICKNKKLIISIPQKLLKKEFFSYQAPSVKIRQKLVTKKAILERDIYYLQHTVSVIDRIINKSG